MAKSRRVAPAPFLTKTHKMIEDCKTNDVISWGENGDSFIVWKPIEFANDLLPIHFKHDRFSSFIRQLNTYGFRKVMPDKWEFANEKFKRGEYDLLREIQRRKTQLPSITHTVSPSILSPTAPSLLPLVRSHDDLPCSSSTSTIRDLSQLSNENAELRQEKHTLTTEIAQTKQICEGLLDSLSRFVDVKQLDLRFLMEDDPMKDSEDMMNLRGATPDTYEAKEKDENSVVLFGVVMKACIQNQHKEDRTRKRRDLCGVSDRSKKLAQPAI